MKYTLWALLFFLFFSASSSYAQAKRSTDALSVDQRLNFVPYVPAPSMNAAVPTPGVAPTVSVAELHIPSKARHELELAVKAFKAHDLQQSATHLEKVLQIYPQYTVAHNTLGALYVDLHQYDKAVPEFEKATAANPGSVAEMHNLGAALYLQKRFPEAESTARAILAIDPLRSPSQFLLACALVAQDRFTPEAEDLLRRTSAQFPNARLILAKVLLKRGAVEEAETEMRAYLEVPNAPGKDGVQCNLAILEHNADKASCASK
jgi:Tfp pilus assembly protein PilF